MLRAGHERVVDRLLAEHRAHRTQPLVMPLATVIRSGVTPKCSAANGEPSRPKPVMTSSKISRMPCLSQIRAQTLQVAFGGSSTPVEPATGFDDHRGDGRGIVQRDQPLQIVREFGAVLGHAARERVLRQIVGMSDVIRARQQRAEGLAVAGDAADRDAAEVHGRGIRAHGRSAGCASFATAQVVAIAIFKRRLSTASDGVRL